MSSPISKNRREIIELAICTSHAFGVPKSVGEIFGYIFGSPVPVSFEDVADDLGMSNGSVSQGLRFLRRVGAIKATYVERDRRDFYVAEDSLRSVVDGFITENLLPHFARGHLRLMELRSKLMGVSEPKGEELVKKVELLIGWHGQGIQALRQALATLE